MITTCANGYEFSSVVAAEPDAKVKWTPLFAAKSLDGWKSANFGGEGEVRMSAKGVVELDAGNTLTGVTYQKAFPKTSYEVQLQAMRVDGTDFFCGLTFPVGDSHCSLIVGGWGGSVVGLSNIDDEDASENDTTKYISFKSKQWYAIRVRVTRKNISAWVDGKQVANQDIVDRKISIRPEVDLSRPLGFSAWQTKARLRKMEYRTF